jgi:hypothetical protein
LKIAPQHLPGGWRHGYEPVCSWPDDCYVQWGDRGLVLRERENGGSYATAFFESFPEDPKTFIRGEGATVEAAERSAFAKFERYRACSGHELERRGYTNGAGFCKHCGLFVSNAFDPIEPPPGAKKPMIEKLFEALSDNHESE